MRNFIAHLIFDKEWIWLEAIINTLCQLEMNIKLALNKELYNKVEVGYICGQDGEIYAKKDIPENSFYCTGCIYSDTSVIASMLYGYQSNGYCHLLGKGDFEVANRLGILWDGCKECGINEDLEEMEEQPY